MAHAGVASRRASERLIVAGRVEVNGRVVTQLGTKVDPEKDTIRVDGRPISPSEQKVYYLLHKPKGVVSSAHDPQGRPTVVDLLKGVKKRVYPVGRLDYDSEGLVLLTNDGDIAYVLTHPRYRVPKRYLVEVEGRPHPGKLKTLARGIKLEDGWTAPAKVKLVENRPDSTILVMEIYEGRKRQIRRMCQAVGHPVRSLKRFQLGPLNLEDLPPGSFRPLTPAEIKALKSLAAQRKKP